MATFADRVREARLGKGLTQEQLATALGVARPTVTQYESGRRHPDSIDTLNRLAGVLAVTVDWLTGRVDTREPAGIGEVPQIRALLRSVRGLTDEEREDVLEYIAWKREQRRRKEQRHAGQPDPAGVGAGAPDRGPVDPRKPR